VSSDKVRVLRLIEYSGSREAIEQQLTRSMKDGTHDHLERAEIEADPRSLEQIMLEDGKKVLGGYEFNTDGFDG
jgi:hypothetical protein